MHLHGADTVGDVFFERLKSEIEAGAARLVAEARALDPVAARP